MATTQTLSVSGVLFSDRRVWYPEPDEVAHLRPAVTPFLSDLYAMGPIQMPDPDFKQFEYRDSFRNRYLDVNDAAPGAWSNPGSGVGNPGATITTTFENPVGLSIDDSLIGQTFEIWNSALSTKKGLCLVTAVSGSDLTLKALGLETDADFTTSALADEDRFIWVAPAAGEGASALEAYNDEVEFVANSCQEFRTSVKLTTARQKARTRAGNDERSRLRTARFNEHKVGINRAMWLGIRGGGLGAGVANGAGGGTDSTFISHQTDANGNTVRTTMGLITAIQRYGSTSGDAQNIFTINSSTYTYSNFVDDMEKIFQYDPNAGIKKAYCGPTAYSYWSKLDGSTGLAGKSTWSVNIQNGESALGYNVKIVETPHGLLQLVRDNSLIGPYAGYMVIPTDGNVRVVKHEDDEFNMNILQDNAPRVFKDEFYSNVGLGIRLVESHALMKVT